ncbi:MAG: LysR family transcriptional regulator [Terriglobales bacterium]
MEFMQLRMFRLVAEERSVQRAARRVLRTQPAVSFALKKLEQEVGVPLFDPLEPRRYTLTTAGHLLYSYAVRLEQLEAETRTALRHLIEKDRPVCRTATVGALALQPV